MKKIKLTILVALVLSSCKTNQDNITYNPNAEQRIENYKQEAYSSNIPKMFFRIKISSQEVFFSEDLTNWNHEDIFNEYIEITQKQLKPKPNFAYNRK